MNRRLHAIPAALLTLVLLSQPLLTTIALADDGEELVCREESHDARYAPTFEGRVQFYSDAYRKHAELKARLEAARARRDSATVMYLEPQAEEQALDQIMHSAALRGEVFAQPGSSDYLAKLAHLDQLGTSSANDAIYALAKELQTEWESRFAIGLGRRRADRVSNATRVGAIIGLAALAISMKPKNVPRWFKLVRYAFPAAGSFSGRNAARAMNSLGYLEGEVPVSPAHVMRLGIQSDEFAMSEETLYREFTAIAAGTAVTAAVMTGVKVFRAANLAATPAKLHPAVLVGSLLLGFAVEEGIGAWMDHRTLTGLQDKVKDAARKLDAANRSNDHLRAYGAADALVRHSQNLAKYLNRSAYEAIREFGDDVAEAAEDHGEGTPKYRQKINELTGDLSNAVRETLGERAESGENDLEGYLVRGFLRNHEEGTIEDLSATAQTRARTYVHGFNRWLEAREIHASMSMGSSDREFFFKEFLKGLDDSRDRRLTRELLSGNLRSDPQRILLQSAALIRSTGRAYLMAQANHLTSMITRTDLLMATATGGLNGGDL